MIPLPVGAKAPDFTLANELGDPVTLSDVLQQGRVLLIFYPADWGFICRQEIVAFRDMHADFAQAGFRLVAISYNDTVSHGLWSDHLKLMFPLLSDRDMAVSKAYGVYDDKEDSFNRDRSERALIMVGRDQVIDWVWVASNSWLEPDYDEVLESARRVAGTGVIHPRIKDGDA